MKRERGIPYRTYVLGSDDSRTPLEARGIVVELEPGVEVEIDLAPHPNFAGHLVLLTPPAAEMERVYEAGYADDFSVMFGASNVVHVRVERRKHSSAAKGRQGPTPPTKSSEPANGEETPTSQRSPNNKP